jgi:nicotinamidase-related amidase
MHRLKLDLRYYHLTRRAGITESEFHHQNLNVELSTTEVALVLVDVWGDHYIKTHLERGHDITINRIKPVVEAFRNAAAMVVHAPSPDCAKKYSQWTQYAGDDESFGATGMKHDEWPPSDFRKKTGEYEKLSRPRDPQDPAFDDIIKNRSIIPEVAPQDGDYVVVTGAHLHRLLKAKKILHLFYAGFAANMCVPFRDYGMRAMKSRGYDVSLIRDCTAAIEVAETIGQEMLTKASVIDVEVNIGTTVSSAELIASCNAKV